MNRTVQVLAGFARFFTLFLLEEALRRIPGFRRVAGRRFQPRNPRRLRAFCEDMGGAFVKFGQFFSIRSDILPRVYCDQLATLFDQVPPFPAEEARARIEEELGAPVDELFAEFRDEAIGAASFGQGHLVTLRDPDAGRKAIVKVSRPGARRRIDTDTRLLVLLGRIVDVSSVLGKVKLVPVFRDFARWTRREVHFRQEGKNADHLHEVSHWNVRQRIPYIYWDLTTDRVLTMEYLDGVPFSRVVERVGVADGELDEELAELGCDRQTLARNLWQSFLLQTFVGTVFHADPHPGNLVVLPENTVGFVDFGLLGRLNEEARREQMLLFDAVVQENIENLFIAVLDLLDAPRGLVVSGIYESFTEVADEWLDACDNEGAPFEEKSITRLVDAAMSIARRIGLVLPMQTMLFYKALFEVDMAVLRIDPDFDYKKETRRAIRLIRMRKLEQMVGPGAVIDRALSIQLLAHAAPDVLAQRLQELEQGRKSIYRKLNVLPVAVAQVLRAAAVGAAGLFLGGLAHRAGWLDGLPLLDHPAVVRWIEALSPSPWLLPPLIVLLLWGARYAVSRSYVKVQQD